MADSLPCWPATGSRARLGSKPFQQVNATRRPRVKAKPSAAACSQCRMRTAGSTKGLMLFLIVDASLFVTHRAMTFP